MPEKTILSEKPEDNKDAAEWGRKQAELIKKGEEITKRLSKNTSQLSSPAIQLKRIKDIFRHQILFKTYMTSLSSFPPMQSVITSPAGKNPHLS